MDDMTDSCTYPHTQWEDIKDRLPVSTVLQAVWDEPQRVVRLMLPKAGLLSTFDVEYIMWLFECPDVTVVLHNSFRLDADQFTWPYLTARARNVVFHSFKVFELNDEGTFAERQSDGDSWCAMGMPDFCRYLQLRASLLAHRECNESVLEFIARVESPGSDLLFEYTRPDGSRAQLHPLRHVIYLIDMDVTRFFPELDNELRAAAVLPVLPASKSCMLQQLNPTSRPFMGPNMYVTPPGSTTWFHEDGHGTVDSGHLVVSGCNEVLMLKRMDETGKQAAIAHFAAPQEYSLRAMPHNAGFKPKWPTMEQVESSRDLGMGTSHLILYPGDYLHINKGRLHAFRKLEWSQTAEWMAQHPKDIAWGKLVLDRPPEVPLSAAAPGRASAAAPLPGTAIDDTTTRPPAASDSPMDGPDDAVAIRRLVFRLLRHAGMRHPHALAQPLLHHELFDPLSKPPTQRSHYRDAGTGWQTTALFQEVAVRRAIAETIASPGNYFPRQYGGEPDVCVSIAWDWMFAGQSLSGTVQEAATATISALHNCTVADPVDSLGVPGMAVSEMMQSIVAMMAARSALSSCAVAQASADWEHESTVSEAQIDAMWMPMQPWSEPPVADRCAGHVVQRRGGGGGGPRTPQDEIQRHAHARGVLSKHRDARKGLKADAASAAKRMKSSNHSEQEASASAAIAESATTAHPTKPGAAEAEVPSNALPASTDAAKRVRGAKKDSAGQPAVTRSLKGRQTRRPSRLAVVIIEHDDDDDDDAGGQEHIADDDTNASSDSSWDGGQDDVPMPTRTRARRQSSALTPRRQQSTAAAIRSSPPSRPADVPSTSRNTTSSTVKARSRKSIRPAATSVSTSPNGPPPPPQLLEFSIPRARPVLSPTKRWGGSSRQASFSRQQNGAGGGNGRGALAANRYGSHPPAADQGMLYDDLADAPVLPRFPETSNDTPSAPPSGQRLPARRLPYPSRCGGWATSTQTITLSITTTATAAATAVAAEVAATQAAAAEAEAATAATTLEGSAASKAKGKMRRQNTQRGSRSATQSSGTPAASTSVTSPEDVNPGDPGDGKAVQSGKLVRQPRVQPKPRRTPPSSTGSGAASGRAKPASQTAKRKRRSEAETPSPSATTATAGSDKIASVDKPKGAAAARRSVKQGQPKKQATSQPPKQRKAGRSVASALEVEEPCSQRDTIIVPIGNKVKQAISSADSTEITSNTTPEQPIANSVTGQAACEPTNGATDAETPASSPNPPAHSPAQEIPISACKSEVSKEVPSSPPTAVGTSSDEASTKAAADGTLVVAATDESCGGGGAGEATILPWTQHGPRDVMGCIYLLNELVQMLSALTPEMSFRQLQQLGPERELIYLRVLWEPPRADGQPVSAAPALPLASEAAMAPRFMRHTGRSNTPLPHERVLTPQDTWTATAAFRRHYSQYLSKTNASPIHPVNKAGACIDAYHSASQDNARRLQKVQECIDQAAQSVVVDRYVSHWQQQGVDPYGLDGYTCQYCRRELANEYYHCLGCDFSMQRDWNLCVCCHEQGRWRVDDHAAGHMGAAAAAASENPPKLDPTVRGRRCRTCCRKPSVCVCHTLMQHRFRMYPTNGLDVLQRCPPRDLNPGADEAQAAPPPPAPLPAPPTSTTAVPSPASAAAPVAAPAPVCAPSDTLVLTMPRRHQPRTATQPVVAPMARPVERDTGAQTELSLKCYPSPVVHPHGFFLKRCHQPRDGRMHNAELASVLTEKWSGAAAAIAAAAEAETEMEGAAGGESQADGGGCKVTKGDGGNVSDWVPPEDEAKQVGVRKRKRGWPAKASSTKRQQQISVTASQLVTTSEAAASVPRDSTSTVGPASSEAASKTADVGSPARASAALTFPSTPMPHSTPISTPKRTPKPVSSPQTPVTPATQPSSRRARPKSTKNAGVRMSRAPTCHLGSGPRRRSRRQSRGTIDTAIYEVPSAQARRQPTADQAASNASKPSGGPHQLPVAAASSPCPSCVPSTTIFKPSPAQQEQQKHQSTPAATDSVMRTDSRVSWGVGLQPVNDSASGSGQGDGPNVVWAESRVKGSMEQEHELSPASQTAPFTVPTVSTGSGLDPTTAPVVQTEQASANPASAQAPAQAPKSALVAMPTSGPARASIPTPAPVPVAVRTAVQAPMPAQVMLPSVYISDSPTARSSASPSDVDSNTSHPDGLRQLVINYQDGNRSRTGSTTSSTSSDTTSLPGNSQETPSAPATRPAPTTRRLRITPAPQQPSTTGYTTTYESRTCAPRVEYTPTQEPSAHHLLRATTGSVIAQRADQPSHSRSIVLPAGRWQETSASRVLDRSVNRSTNRSAALSGGVAKIFLQATAQAQQIQRPPRSPLSIKGRPSDTPHFVINLPGNGVGRSVTALPPCTQSAIHTEVHSGDVLSSTATDHVIDQQHHYGGWNGYQQQPASEEGAMTATHRVAAPRIGPPTEPLVLSHQTCESSLNSYGSAPTTGRYGARLFDPLTGTFRRTRR